MNGRDLAFLKQVHHCWDATTEYFQHLEQRHAGFVTVTSLPAMYDMLSTTGLMPGRVCVTKVCAIILTLTLLMIISKLKS
jgi:hypothetical protein